MRFFLRNVACLLLTSLCLLLVACGGTSKVQVHSTPTPLPTAGPGQQLLMQSSQLLGSAQTLHGIFDATISGQLLQGELDSEVWRMGSNKSRALVQKSTLSQFVTGLLEVDDGQQLWQYNPRTRVVYTGSASSSISTTSRFGENQDSDVPQLILSLVQDIFEHSVATLVSQTETVNGHPVYMIHVSPQPQTGSSATDGLSYDGTVSLDRQTRLPLALDLTLQGLGLVHLAVVNLQLNTSLSADLFTFSPPPGVTVEPFPAGSTTSGSGSLSLQQAEQQAGYHLLSIPSAQTAYQLQSIDALGAPGNQIYTLTYTFRGQTFTLSEGKALANLPVSGQSLSLRGTTGTLAVNGSTTTLSWTEKSVGIQISGPLNKQQVLAVAGLLV